MSKATYIPCIGIDNNLHYCSPHKDACLCGVKVKNKKIGRDDWKRYWCGECDYSLLEEGD
jgi:hypothetical protein